MIRLIRTEWMKLKYNWVLGIMLAMLCFIAYILAGSSFGMLPEYLTAETPQFFIGIEMTRGEHVFERVMRDSSFTAWLSIIFAALFIGVDFTNRSINQYIFAGHSRLNIFIVKIVQCYIIACLASAIYPIISCMRYSVPWLIEADANDWYYIFRCIGLRVIIDMAMMNISIITTFALRDFIRPMIATLITTLVLVQFLGIKYSLDPNTLLYKILTFYPGYQYGEVMHRSATNEQLNIALISSICFIFITIITSYFIFRNAELS